MISCANLHLDASTRLTALTSTLRPQLWSQLCQIITDLQTDFQPQILLYIYSKVLLKIPPYLAHGAILPCKIFGSRNCRVQEVSEANYHVRLKLPSQIQPLKLVYKSPHLEMWALFNSLKNIFTISIPRNRQNGWLYVSATTIITGTCLLMIINIQLVADGASLWAKIRLLKFDICTRVQRP